ncbi:phosphoribosyltransferase [Arthrobacter sp. KK5.5]|uniref:phosphoribosyltransferase n=1 Tax=Arthrobacter sp. KK5.5 TaxID=3373084 RepID=UPI003EE67EFE
MRRFKNRSDAGRELATALSRRGLLSLGTGGDGTGPRSVVVFGLARGGVPVAAEVARAAGVPVRALVVRKVSAPGFEEYALGAVAAFAGEVAVVRNAGQDEGPEFDAAVARQLPELQRRELLFGTGGSAPDLADRTAVLVDDGLATGATMLAAVQAVRSVGPAAVVVAVPVALGRTRAQVEAVADDVLALQEPAGMRSVGAAYDDFTQTSEGDVLTLLGLTGGSQRDT